MRSLVVVSLILILVVVIGVTIRGTIFRKYLPEGFENANGSENTNGSDEKKEKDGDKKSDDTEKNGGESGSGSGNGNGNGNGGENGNGSGNGNGNGNGGGSAVQVDTTSGMNNFMAELGGNEGAMNNISRDTQAMIQNQQELMRMMESVQPALTQGMEFMKAFKGMMGNN